MASIKDTFSKGITTLNLKTSTMLEQNKINTHISTLESEIEALKKQAGHILWEKWNKKEFSLDDVEELLVTINQKLAEIENQRKRAEEIHQEEKQILGGQQLVAPQSQTGDVVFCSNCGAQSAAGFKFCTKCGNALEK